MLPREYLRENAERLLAEMPERFGKAGLETYVELDRERRDAVTNLEENSSLSMKPLERHSIQELHNLQGIFAPVGGSSRAHHGPAS